MLAHWHSQGRRLQSAAARRFLGVVGHGHAQVFATAVFASADVPHLSLLVCNARPDVGARDVERCLQL